MIIFINQVNTLISTQKNQHTTQTIYEIIHTEIIIKRTSRGGARLKLAKWKLVSLGCVGGVTGV